MEKQQRFIKFLKTIQFGLVFCNLIILFFSVVLIVFYNQKSNNDILMQTTQSFMDMTSKSLLTHVRGVLGRIENATKNGAMIFAEHPSTDKLYNIDIRTMVGYINQSVYITNVYFAKSDGTFYSLIRRSEKDTYKEFPDKTLPSGVQYCWKNVITKDDDRIEKYTYFDQDLKEVGSEVVKDSKYDPRQRPWYTDSKNDKACNWTDVYYFVSTQEAGITAAIPMFDHEYKMQTGVFGIDIGLSSLQKLLEQSKATANAQLYVISESNKVICSTAGLKAKLDAKNNSIFPDIMEKEFSYIKRFLDTALQENLNGAELRYAEHQGEEMIVQTSDLQIGSIKWKLLYVTPVDDLLEPIKKKRQMIIIYCSFILIIASSIMFLFARRISFLISKLSKAAAEIENFHLDESIEVESRIHEIQVLSQSMKSMQQSMKSFAQYVPKDLVLRLMRGNFTRETGEYKELTLMFTDIANFTSISEHLKPNDLIQQLSDYFEAMTQIVLDQGGNVDKYIGDAIMGFWGAPEPNARHASDACHAALKMQRVLRTKNADWINLGLPAFTTRIGIHTGNVIVGNIGSQLRMNYTAIGDDVNLASRLEGLNKHYGTEILISGDTYFKVSADFLARPLGKVAVKGKEIYVPIYELVGALRHVDTKLLLSPDQMKEYEKYRVAYDYFEQRRFSNALEIFHDIEHKDGPVLMMIEECKKLCKKPPEDDWKGFVKNVKEK